MKPSIIESDPNTFVICKECNNKYPQVTHTHLRHKHKMSLKDYTLKHNIIYKDLVCRSVQETKKITKENFIKKYGEVEGLKRWKTYKEKQSYSNSFEYKKNKYNWTEEEYRIYNKNRACTLENFIKRHGENKGRYMWEEYKKKQSYAGCAEEYFIEKYGEVEGKEKFLSVCRSKASTIEKFIDKYGEILGLEKWKKMIEKKLERRQQSNMANTFFDNILKKLPSSFYDSIYYDRKNTEYFFTKKGVSLMFVDFYYEPTRKIIEFAGDYWHGNPAIYKEDFIVKQSGCTSRDLYEKTLKRVNILEKEFNCKVLLIWENEYLKNKEECIEKAANFILMD